MRKKSHISLARYIVANTKDEELKKHKLSFYIGSILPDCKPSFVYKRHEINATFPLVRRNIAYLVEGKKNHTPKRKRMYYKNLGEITHYVADYFTFPHNKTYPGTLKDHCTYGKTQAGSARFSEDGESKTDRKRQRPGFYFVRGSVFLYKTAT